MMKKMLLLVAIASLSACAGPSPESWYGKKLADQDRRDSTLNAPTPDRADRDRGRWP